MHVFPGRAKASLVGSASVESIAKTFNEHPTVVHWLYIAYSVKCWTRRRTLKSWTKSSPRESGRHHTQPLWKEIGLNGDNSSKQAAGTMRKNCSFCALKTLHRPCPPDFIHTFYSHSYNSHSAEVMDKFFDKGDGTSPGWSNSETLGFWGDSSFLSHAFIKSFLNSTRGPKAGTLACWQFNTLFFALASIAEKMLLSAQPFRSDTLDSSTDLAPKMKASQFGRQQRRGALQNRKRKFDSQKIA